MQVANVEPMEVAGAAMQKPVISGGRVRVANAEPMEVAGATSCERTLHGRSWKMLHCPSFLFSRTTSIIESQDDLDSALPPFSPVQSSLVKLAPPSKKNTHIKKHPCGLQQPLRSEVKNLSAE